MYLIFGSFPPISPSPSQERPYPHAIVAGIERYPRKVTRGMGKKRMEKRSKVKPFIKVGFNSITRRIVSSERGWRDEGSGKVWEEQCQRTVERRARPGNVPWTCSAQGPPSVEGQGRIRMRRWTATLETLKAESSSKIASSKIAIADRILSFVLPVHQLQPSPSYQIRSRTRGS